MRKNANLLIGSISFTLCRTQNQRTGHSCNATTDDQYIVHYLSLSFSSISFDILKIRRMKIAQKEAAMPISAIMLSPSKRWLKSKSVMLKIISASAIKTSV